jgi:drug/metabolite transporter (DMT)-like permease
VPVTSLRVPRTWPAALAAIAGSALVGVMPLAALHLYADGLSAPSMLFWRYAIAILALGTAATIAGLKLPQAWRDGAWRVVLLGATLGAGQTLCFWESIKTLETSVAVLLFYTYPAVTVALDRFVFKTRVRPLSLLCIGAILFGAALITGPGLHGGTLDPRGLAWALPSPLIYAVYLAINARILRRHPPLIGAAGLFSGMAVTFGLISACIGLDTPSSAAGWALLLFVGLGPGAVTMTLFTYSLPRIGASSFAIPANTELVVVVSIGVLVLGEPMTPWRAAGGVLIVAGIVVHIVTRREPLAPRTDIVKPLPAAARPEPAG